MKHIRLFLLLAIIGPFPVLGQGKNTVFSGASWIGAPDTAVRYPLFKRNFSVEKLPGTAVLNITAHGFYIVYLNGKRIGDGELAPGWTSYHKRLLYQRHEVRALLQKGNNTLTVQLSPGFYSGNCGNFGDRKYGNSPALLLQLDADRSPLLCSGPQWNWAKGELLSSDIYDGETRDLRRKLSGWAPVRVFSADTALLLPQDHPPVRKFAPVVPVKTVTDVYGRITADFGQNMAAVVRVGMSGKAGDTLIVEHAELLDENADLSKNSLREARQTDRYILAGDQPVSLEPWFTYHGFRYARISLKRNGGFVPFRAAHIAALPMHTDLKEAGSFSCGNPALNRLQEAIRQSLLSNFVDIPTDCPQRTERLGWTGDAQATAAAACYNFDARSFYAKYLADLAADQYANGLVPNVIPDFQPDKIGGDAPGWADAATVIPWQLFELYGDTSLLRLQYPAMKKWVERMAGSAAANNGLWAVREGIVWGDWLAPEGGTDGGFLCQAFYCHSLDIVSRAAKALNMTGDLAAYDAWSGSALKAFRDVYLNGQGKRALSTQTAYVLTLAFGLCPEEQKKELVDKLLRDIADHGGHLNTGYLGTRYLLPVLVSSGNAKTAYRVLLKQDYPGWLYMLGKGATTLWESWDAILPDGSFNKERHSMNHHILGCIGEWFYSGIGGIRPVDPGFATVRIAPVVEESLGWAKVNYRSPHGLISSSWKISGGRVSLEVTIPKGTVAEIVVPNKDNTRFLTYRVRAGRYHYLN
ncbi:alpha-L-rhamnosidase [Mucilaginibacter pineti]|uniref:alpha-L-rhamnosidase n=1 Tax=Mucilaginibacter pineti TaxID=1391627 RepID=A0A1G7IHK2_9SPHI|nr:alpha-L-rhamnosidase [Mucilaginibacter pineti]SDF12172.1 alpha-L-rhamnosidase [Mucilaginibacter pineti]